jgi:hypothetical protein
MATKAAIQSMINAARTSSVDLVYWIELKAILEAMLNQDVVFEISLVVGEVGAPVDGATNYTNAGIVGELLLVHRNGILQPASDPGDGDTYFTRVGTTLTFSTALSTGEKIHIVCVDL